MKLLVRNSSILFLLLWMSILYGAGETITILNPANGSTVSGVSLAMSGTTSKPFSLIRIMLNTTVVGKTFSGSSGSWNFSTSMLADGDYTITADLLDSSFAKLATTTNAFTIENPATITIISPKESETLSTLLPAVIAGTSSLPNESVKISIDSVEAATVPTDSNGDWQLSYPFLVDGNHTLLAELMTASLSEVMASATVDFTSLNPVSFSSGVSKIRVLQGSIPTTGSGTDSGFSYSVSGSTATITFAPAFAATPFVIATGQQISGNSAVTISSVTTLSVDITFTVGTERIHFQATLLQ